MRRENWKALQRWVRTIVGTVAFLSSVFVTPHLVLAQGTNCDNATPIEFDERNMFNDRFQLNADEKHFFRIETPSDGLLNVFTTEETDTRGLLYNADCAPVNDMNYANSGLTLRNFHFSVGDPRVDPLPAGVYYVEVRGQFSTSTGPYSNWSLQSQC